MFCLFLLELVFATVLLDGNSAVADLHGLFVPLAVSCDRLAPVSVPNYWTD